MLEFVVFGFSANKISIVPGQPPNVLGEGWIWCEVDISEVECLYFKRQHMDNFRTEVSKNFPYNKVIFISTDFGGDSLLLA